MTPIEVDKVRVRRWLTIHGGEISRHRLRRYRPQRSRWLPVEAALQELILDGEVIEYCNPLESIERGYGPPTIRYKLAGSFQ
jgi:hypothetical protein